jgi:flagella basal body P-ring formation protein FlgA
VATPAQAQSDASAVVKKFLERETAGMRGRVQIAVGTPDARVAPAPCAKLEPFLPGGARPWGRASVGVRCADGKPWSNYLPVEVRVYEPVLVAVRALSAGQPVSPTDAELTEIDITRYPPGLMQGPEARKVLARPVAVGQPLRKEYFRMPTYVTAGDPVRLVYQGEGFSVSTEGRALGTASDGDSVRVQTAQGRIVTGVARGPRLVEMQPAP